MFAHLPAYLLVVAVITVAPGPDTVLVVNRSIRYGCRRGITTAAGSAGGLLVWGAASAAGIAALIAASGTAFTAVKIAGAAYLAILGLWLIIRPGARETAAEPAQAEPAGRGFLVQGLLTNLTNPKAGAFFTALLPQFLATGGAARLTALVYAAIAAGASLTGLSLYAAAAARLRTVLASRRARRTFDRSTGAVLLALGARLAIDHR